MNIAKFLTASALLLVLSACNEDKSAAPAASDAPASTTESNDKGDTKPAKHEEKKESQGDLASYAKDTCACKDTDCLKGLAKKYEHLPELRLKLSEVDALPAEKKAPLEKATDCALALQ